MKRESTLPPGPLATDPVPPTFEAIYASHWRWVWWTVRRLGVPARWCANAAQEVFLVVHRRLSEYQPRNRLKGWLGAIAARVAKAFQRRELPRVESFDEGTGSDAHALLAVADREREIGADDELQRVLDDLDADQRYLLLTHHRDEVPVGEIAVHMGIPVGTVQSRLHHARQAFKAAWKRQRARDRRGGANVFHLFGPMKLLVADRQTPPLPDGVREHLWSGIQRALRNGGGGHGSDGGSGGSTPGAGPATVAPVPPAALAGELSGTLAVTLAVIFVALAAAGAFAAGVLVGRASERPVPAVQREIAAQPPAPTPAPPSPPPAPSGAAAAASIAPTASAAPAPLGAWRFHGGDRRAEEREALSISALLQAGRIGEARTRLKSFERAYPNSPRLDPFREALASP